MRSFSIRGRTPGRLISALLLSMTFLAQASAAETLFVYGPGGPAPAMKEAAAAFEKQSGTKVEVTAGPTPSWIGKAQESADVIYSGSETMMTDFTVAMGGRIVEQTIVPLYLRPLAILVRPGNPKHIKGVKDIVKPGIKMLVINGAGQNGVWEDMAGRKGDIDMVRAVRSNISNFAPNSALARQTWIDHPEIDVWLIWNIWQVANPTLADLVPIEPDYAIYRDTGVGLTLQGTRKPAAKEFVEFLRSTEGARIFKKWGWRN